MIVFEIELLKESQPFQAPKVIMLFFNLCVRQKYAFSLAKFPIENKLTRDTWDFYVPTIFTVPQAHLELMA